MSGVDPLVLANQPETETDTFPVTTNVNAENLLLLKPSFKSSRVLKVRVLKFLNQGARHGQRNIYEWFVVALIFATLTFTILCTVDIRHKKWVNYVSVALEVTFLACSFVEYILRAWSATATATYRQSGGLFRYFVTPKMIVDAVIILSSISVIICFLTNHGNRKITCFLQLTRLLRIDRKQGALQMFSESFKNHRQELLTCWYMGFFMVVLVSFLVYALESKETGYTVDNLLNGLYWGMVSLTCIGYGDLAPKSAVSKVLTCSFAFFGGCFLALPAGIIGSGFAIQVAKQQKEKHVIRRRRPAAVVIQSFWRLFAASKDMPATWLPHIRAREGKQDRRCRKSSVLEVLQSRSFDVMVGHGVNNSVIQRKDSNCITENSEKEVPFQERKDGPISNGTWPTRKISFAPHHETMVATNALTATEKIALRFIRHLTCISALKKFKQARRPYDERDILDQFASSHTEMYEKLQGIRKQTEIFYAYSDQKISEIENHITVLDTNVALIQRKSEETNKLLRLYFERSGTNMRTYTET